MLLRCMGIDKLTQEEIKERKRPGPRYIESL
jgi:hypothetical protein